MLNFRTIPEMLDVVENIALSDIQIKEKTGYNVITYNTIIDEYINGMQTVSLMIEKLGNGFICLIEQEQGRGHYICVYLHSNGKLQVYDSYGLGVSKILKFSPYSLAKSVGLDIFNLICKNSRIEMDSNIYQHQRFNNVKEKYMTCGFHTIVRLKMYEYTNKQFHDFINSLEGVKTDYVTLLMSYLLFKV